MQNGIVGCRAKTEEEIREEFLQQIWDLIDYWDNTSNTSKEKLEGFAHSILANIDGMGLPLPGFKLIPYPHERDKEFYIENGENWYPDDVDIAGNLHYEFFKYKRG